MNGALKLVWCMTPLTSELMRRRNPCKEVNIIGQTFVNFKWLFKLKVSMGGSNLGPLASKANPFSFGYLLIPTGYIFTNLIFKKSIKTITGWAGVLKICIWRLLGVFWAFLGYFPQVWEWNHFLKGSGWRWSKHYWSNWLSRNFIADEWL